MKNTILLFVKGLAMGLADLVPGISGGTVAFLSGIYPRLLTALKSVNLHALQTLRKQGFVAFWQEIDGGFLATLFAGIATSILLFSKLVQYLLNHEPVLLYALFFGLIFASTWLLFRQASWKFSQVFYVFLGAFMVYQITHLQAQFEIEHTWYFFFCGAIAICAMILPGISGSFVLLILGAYYPILQALNDRNILVLLVFLAGIVTGLLSFVHLVSYCFQKYKNQILSVLIGFLIGSFPMLYPWQTIVSTRVNSHGELVPFLKEAVLPWHYAELSVAEQTLGIVEKNPKILFSLILAISAFLVVFLLEKNAKHKQAE